MGDQLYLQRLKTLLNFDFKVLCPWKTGEEHTKFSTFFKCYYISHVALVLLAVAFLCCEWNTLTFESITENLALVVGASRSIAYSTLVLKFYDDYKERVHKMLGERKSLPSQPQEHILTARFCKTEFIITFAFQLLHCSNVFVFFHAFVYFSPNDYHLPLNFYIIFLPPDGFLFAWELNYLFITVSLTCAGIFFMCYAALPLLLMNQSCWLIDMALMTAERMNRDLQLDEDIHEPLRVAKTHENIKEFVGRCEKFVEWQSEVQHLLQWNFDLEFQVQSFILCLSIYVLSFGLSGVLMILLLLVFCFAQLFFYCWMGSRVTSRIDQLSYEISKNWYLMLPSQRKSVQMVLHWTQNMEGFSGVFKDVSLETFQAILEASYSFYTFLRSTNGN